MKRRKQKKYVLNTSEAVRGYIEQFFEVVTDPMDFLRSNTFYSTDGGIIRNEHVPLPLFVIRKGKRAKWFRASEGAVIIKDQRLLEVDLLRDYFNTSAGLPDFFYEKESGVFHLLKFVFENNTIEGFNAQSLHERCEFRGNCVGGFVSGLFVSDRSEKFFDENEMADGIELSDCTFKNQSVSGKKIKKLINVTALEKLSFTDCEIEETNFCFEGCPIVQFLGKTRINKITDMHKVSPHGYLNEGDGVRDIYISEQMDLDTNNHTPEEKQYFFRQIKLFQEKRGDRIQALFAHRRYLQWELKLERLRWWERWIIYVSHWFGGGLSLVRPVCMLLLSFSFLSAITCSLDLSFLFPMFPHVMFAEIEDVTMLFAYSDLLKNLIFSVYYVILVLSWYFIIKSLHKFTYRK